MMASLFECRIEVYRDLNVFKLKSSDVTVSRIARIFKVSYSYAGAYPGFEKGGCLRTIVVSVYRAQIARQFFRDLAH